MKFKSLCFSSLTIISIWALNGNLFSINKENLIFNDYEFTSKTFDRWENFNKNRKAKTSYHFKYQKMENFKSYGDVSKGKNSIHVLANAYGLFTATSGASFDLLVSSNILAPYNSCKIY